LALKSVDERESPETVGGGFTLTAEMQIATYHVKESERLVLLDNLDLTEGSGEAGL